MKLGFITVVMVGMAFAVTCAAENLPPDVSLKPQGKVTYREADEIKSPQCQSHRIYPEISGLASAPVEEALNQKFKKILTVGRKLSAGDCPASSGNERYDYYNTTIVGGQRGPYLGIEFVINYPGGSGRVFHDCHIFNLEDGSEPDLYNLKSDGAITYAQKIYQDRCIADLKINDPSLSMATAKLECKLESQSEPEGLMSGKTHAFCLGADGFYLLRNAYMKNSLPDRISLTSSDMVKIFQPSLVIDTLSGRP